MAENNNLSLQPLGTDSTIPIVDLTSDNNPPNSVNSTDDLTRKNLSMSVRSKHAPTIPIYRPPSTYVIIIHSTCLSQLYHIVIYHFKSCEVVIILKWSPVCQAWTLTRRNSSWTVLCRRLRKLHSNAVVILTRKLLIRRNVPHFSSVPIKKDEGLEAGSKAFPLNTSKSSGNVTMSNGSTKVDFSQKSKNFKNLSISFNNYGLKRAKSSGNVLTVRKTWLVITHQFSSYTRLKVQFSNLEYLRKWNSGWKSSISKVRPQ